MKPLRNITVIGVGLLGGSVGLAAKAADERIRVVGVGRRQTSLDRALACGAVDRVTLDVAEGVAGADLVILATPIGAYEPFLRALAPALPSGADVTDVGSVKSPVVRQAERILGRGGPFVGSHPMAGGERGGVEFARADLFHKAACIVTPTAHTPGGLVERVEAFWRLLGGVVIRLDPRGHDAAVARISHLPHVLAALLVELQREADLPLAGGGFLDSTRIASGDPAMWREILAVNRPAVLAALDRTQKGLQRLRGLVQPGREAALERYLAAAKQRRDHLVERRMRREE